MQHRIILASSSPSRCALLERLKLSFEIISPDIDETLQPAESAEHAVLRLSEEKAAAVKQAHNINDALIIASDQLAVVNANKEIILQKPGTAERALAQLMSCNGRWVTFHTGLCVLQSATGESKSITAQYRVKFRDRSESQYRRYIELEQPLQCAGSFKSEGLGITLFERFEGDDPNSLVGLPLIQLVTLLDYFGVSLLDSDA